MKFSAVPLALGALAAAIFSGASLAKSGPTCVAYVEVNTDSITNVGRYTLSDGSNAFDIAIIFAANIDYDGSQATLYFNQQVQAVLDDAADQIAPLQAKGIKVLLSLLGNHQGAGIDNFATQQDAENFANMVAAAVNQYNLDGIDMDDEYADYGTNGTPGTNSQSIGWFIGALRSAMPNKLITFYYYGPAATDLSNSPASVGEQLDFAWNAIYDTYSAPNVPGLGNSKLSAAAVDITSTPAGDAASFAANTVANGYGAFMTYALNGNDNSAYISGITQNLYGQATTFS